MHPQVKIDRSQLYGWIGWLVACLVLVGLSWGTGFHHLAVGLAISAIVLFVAIALLEGLWQAALYGLRKLGVEIEST